MTPATSKVVNFAYGSNMLASCLSKRVPSARPLGRGELRGYQLRWHKISKDRSGKCDAVPSAESVVHGVLYEIDAREKPKLDRAEGLGNGYAEKAVTVVVDGRRREALIYFATRTDGSLLPYSWYKALVVAGATEHGLPCEYIDELTAVASVEDSDQSRHNQNMAAANAG